MSINSFNSIVCKFFRKMNQNDALQMETQIEIHPVTENPTKAWKSLRSHKVVKNVEPMNRLEPLHEDKIRFVCVSDTHNKMNYILNQIPAGDVFIHAGDFTFRGERAEIEKFNAELGKLPHQHKIVIAGNHELTFDNAFKDKNQNFKNIRPQALLTNCTYLENGSTTVHGYKIFGSPCTPEYFGWAFNVPRGKALLEIWDQIPSDTDILITHGPPIGHGDLCHTGIRAGCVELLETVEKRVKPAFHVFGHIHEGYGVTTNGTTTFINAAICDSHYHPMNAPVIFDLPMKENTKR